MKDHINVAADDIVIIIYGKPGCSKLHLSPLIHVGNDDLDMTGKISLRSN